MIINNDRSNYDCQYFLHFSHDIYFNLCNLTYLEHGIISIQNLMFQSRSSASEEGVSPSQSSDYEDQDELQTVQQAASSQGVS